MGLFSNKKRTGFLPDFTKPGYDNWLSFIEHGGASKEWEKLKNKNCWIFPESETEKFMRYQEEVKQVSDSYYAQLQQIQSNWTVLYNLDSYNSDLAHKFEKDCLSNIEDYKEMLRIDRKHGEKTATNIPAFKRLAMLYEKQGRFEDAVNVCKQAYSFGMDERGRMARMIKKAGRQPTPEEQSLFDKE